MCAQTGICLLVTMTVHVLDCVMCAVVSCDYVVPDFGVLWDVFVSSYFVVVCFLLRVGLLVSYRLCVMMCCCGMPFCCAFCDAVLPCDGKTCCVMFGCVVVAGVSWCCGAFVCCYSVPWLCGDVCVSKHGS